MIITSSVVQADSNSDKRVIYLNQSEDKDTFIFNNEMLISPGDKIIKEFKIINNNNFKSSINRISLKGSLFDNSGNIIDKSKVEYNEFLDNSMLTFYCDGKELFKGNLDEFLSFDLAGEQIIKIGKNESKNCAIEYEISENAGNRIMGVEYKFDMAFDYSEISTIVQTGEMMDFKVLIIIGTLLLSIGLSQIIRKTKLNIKST
jgi:hypothetical protein